MIACAEIRQSGAKHVKGSKVQSIRQPTQESPQNPLDGRSLPPYPKLVYDRLQSLKEIDPASPLRDRLKILYKNDKELSDALVRAFPEVTEMSLAEDTGQSLWARRVQKQLYETPPLPTVAPALWAKDKLPEDTPPDFIQRHYAPWLGKGFTQATLRHLDPQAEKAWRHWKRKNDTPPWFDLPTKSEQLARDSSRLAPLGSSEAEAIRRLGWRMSKQHTR